MRPLLFSLVLSFFSAGTPALAGGPESGDWEVGSVWRLTLIDKAERTPREITFEVESVPANSCLGGDWRKLKVLTSNYEGVSEPAWSLKGNSVKVLITSDVCDAYNQVQGSISRGRFNGPHILFGMGGSTKVGSASAVRIK